MILDEERKVRCCLYKKRESEIFYIKPKYSIVDVTGVNLGLFSSDILDVVRTM